MNRKTSMTIEIRLQIKIRLLKRTVKKSASPWDERVQSSVCVGEGISEAVCGW